MTRNAMYLLHNRKVFDVACERQRNRFSVFMYVHVQLRQTGWSPLQQLSQSATSAVSFFSARNLSRGLALCIKPVAWTRKIFFQRLKTTVRTKYGGAKRHLVEKDIEQQKKTKNKRKPIRSFSFQILLN